MDTKWLSPRLPQRTCKRSTPGFGGSGRKGVWPVFPVQCSRTGLLPPTVDQCGPLSASSGFPWVFQVAWRTFSKRDLNGPDPKTDDECLIRTAIMSPRRLFSFLLSWLPASCSTQPLATAVSNRLPTAGSLPSPQPFCRPAGRSRPLRLSPATVSPQLLPMPPRRSLPRWMQTAH